MKTADLGQVFEELIDPYQYQLILISMHLSLKDWKWNHNHSKSPKLVQKSRSYNEWEQNHDPSHQNYTTKLSNVKQSHGGEVQLLATWACLAVEPQFSDSLTWKA